MAHPCRGMPQGKEYAIALRYRAFRYGSVRYGTVSFWKTLDTCAGPWEAPFRRGLSAPC